MAALFMAVAAYFAIQAFQYLDDPLVITLAYSYEAETAEDVTGYVVRRERVLEDDSGGLLRIQRAEGERVAAGGTVASVYADQASLDRQTEIDYLESRLEQLRIWLPQRRLPGSWMLRLLKTCWSTGVL